MNYLKRKSLERQRDRIQELQADRRKRQQEQWISDLRSWLRHLKRSVRELML